MNEGLTLARKYHINVIPIKPKSKEAATNWKEAQVKHSNTKELQKFIKDGCNLGYVCGSVSGPDGKSLVVIDFDSREAFDNVKSLIPETLVIETSEKEPGWRGKQAYFFTSGIVKIKKVEKNGEELLSIRGEGAYVVAPGSVHPSGFKYEVALDKSIAEVEADFFEEIYLKTCETFKLKRGKKVDIVTILKGVTKGSRDDSLVKLIHWLRKAGVNEEDAYSLCSKWDQNNSSPLGSEYLRRKVDYHFNQVGEPYGYFYTESPKTHEINDKLEVLKRQGQHSQGGKHNITQENQATRIINLAHESGAEFFTDQYHRSFTALQVDGHREIWPIKSRKFKTWLTKLLWQDSGDAPGSEAVSSAVNVLEARATFDGSSHSLANRVTWHDGAIYYDLSNDKWQAVKITAEGWEIVDNPPILFKRYSHQKPQVTPVKKGSFEEFNKLINLSDKNDILLLNVYIATCFIPDIPHTILSLHGSQGSAKTTVFNIIKQTVDPSSVSVMSFPRDVNEMVQKLDHHYLPFFDNITKLQQWHSDALCRAVTGDGFSKRELFTDDEDVIYAFKRCPGLNGINVVAVNPDLLDRSILLGLERIKSQDRKEAREIWETFEKTKPGLLGTIFDVLSKAMTIKKTLKLPNLPRMADFCLWGEAIAIALGHPETTFYNAYMHNIKLQNLEAIEAHPIGTAMLIFVDRLYEGGEGKKVWEGTPSELLDALKNVADEKLINTSQRTWPKAANVLTRRLKEIRTNLMDEGIEVTVDLREGNKGTRKIKICKVSSVSSDRQLQEWENADDTADDTSEVKVPSAIPSAGKPEPADDTDGSDDKIPATVQRGVIAYLRSDVNEGGKHKENLISDLQNSKYKLSRGEAEHILEWSLEKGLIIQKPDGNFILGKKGY